MRKRASAHSKKGKAKAAPQRPRSAALVIVDEGPIRAEALESYHRLEKQLVESRTELEAFEAGDLPAYQRWEAKVFGTLLTELRNTTQELDKQNLVLRAIDEEVFWTGCTDLTAYRRVMKALTDPEPEPAPNDDPTDFDPAEDFGPDEPGFAPEGDKMFGETDLPPGFTAADFDRMPPREKRNFRDFYEQTAELFEIMTGRVAPNLDEVLREDRARRRGGNGAQAGPAPREHQPPPVAPEVQRTEDRVKELYRALVRQLHPDCRPHQTARDRELWHQLQTAYRKRDLELMEAIAGRVELGLNGSATSLPVQILLRLTRDLYEALRGLRKQLTAAKQNPAWCFAKRAAELPQLEAKRRKSLERELRKATMELADIRAILDDLAARAARGKPRRAKKKSARRADLQQDLFGF